MTLWCWGLFFDVECFVALAVDSFVVDCFEFESFTYLDQHQSVVCIIIIVFSCIYLFVGDGVGSNRLVLLLYVARFVVMLGLSRWDWMFVVNVCFFFCGVWILLFRFSLWCLFYWYHFIFFFFFVHCSYFWVCFGSYLTAKNFL